MKEAINYLAAHDFAYAPIILISLLVGVYLIKIIKEASSIDVKKNTREHSRYQMELLTALKKRSSSDRFPTLLPKQDDAADVKVLKEEYWRSHGVSVAAIESLKKEHEEKTLMPITAIKAFVKGQSALEVSDEDKVTGVKYNKISKLFLFSAAVSYVLIIVLIILGINNRFSDSQGVTTLDFVITLLTIPLMLSLFSSYVTFEKFKKNLNAKRFLNLVKPSYKINGLK